MRIGSSQSFSAKDGGVVHENPFPGWQLHHGSCAAWGSEVDVMWMCTGHWVTSKALQIRKRSHALA